MTIQTRDRLKPFSHRPGHEVLVPGTLFSLKVYPALIECMHPFTRQLIRIPLDLRGPFSSFTVESDLEKQQVRIYGESLDGYFRYVVVQQGNFLVFIKEKTPDSERGVRTVLFTDLEKPEKSPFERLFLGSGKAKDFDRIRERRDLREILPLWYAIGQKTPPTKKEQGPMFALLEECIEKIKLKDSDLSATFLALYLAGFSPGFVPRSRDPEYQGIVPDARDRKEPEAFSLLSLGALAIRSLFFLEKEGSCFFHPALPRLFPSGKMIGIRTEGGDLLDMEWTKYRMRKMTIRGAGNGSFTPVFPSSIKRYRLKKTPKEKGFVVKNGDTFSLESGKLFFLDRFEG